MDAQKEIPDKSIQCAVTSPPYYGLRSYLPAGHPDKAKELGTEKTPEEYISKLVEGFEQSKRVLRDDGLLFLNLGDSYAANSNGNPQAGLKALSDIHSPRKNARANHAYQDREGVYSSKSIPEGMKPKDLMLIPHRAAIALQSAGWYLRYAMPWIKRNPMPESCEDRPSSAIEYVFMFSKSERYFYDKEAVKMQYAAATIPQLGEDYQGEGQKEYEMSGVQNPSDTKRRVIESLARNGGRNRRNSDPFFESWQGLYEEDGEPMALIVNTNGFPGAHFATFPKKLVQPLILAGTSAHGCCSKCGSPYERLLEKEKMFQSGSGKSGNPIAGKNGDNCQGGGDTGDVRKGPIIVSRTTGWQKTCSCAEASPVPCKVLDPFGGAFTTALVAMGHGRDAVICELNAEYIKMGKERCHIRPENLL